MAVDPSIALSFRPTPIDNPLTNYTNALQAQGLAQQNALASVTMQEKQAQLQRMNALRSSLQNIDITTPEGQNSLIKSNPFEGPGIVENLLKLDSTRSTTAKNTADAAETNQKITAANVERNLRSLTNVTSPDQVPAWVQGGVDSKLITPEQAKQTLAQVPTDPAGFAKWKQQQQLAGMSIKDQLELTAPKVELKNAGGSLVPFQTNAYAQGGIGTPSGIAPIPITQSADSIASNATSRANNASTQAGENARAAASRQVQLQVAGLGPDGQPSANVESMAQAIAAGKQAPLTGFAAARPAGQLIMSRVMQIDPTYDASSWGAKAKAAKDFTSGSQGNAMRSFAVAGQHLDQLGALADALNNGNLQIVNKIGNAYAQQTGNPAPTNFDAAKDVVSKEVVKAIVAGGGGVAERQELSNLMSNAKSPAQLKGVIDQYRGLMAAQHDALLQQRRAAGLPDSTIPDYGPSASGGSAHPAEINDLLKKYGPGR